MLAANAANSLCVVKRIRRRRHGPPAPAVVPAGFRPAPFHARPGLRSFFDRVRVVLGYEHLTGAVATWAALEERILRYQLEPLVILLSRVAGTLENSGIDDLSRQEMVARAFLSPALHAAWKRDFTAFTLQGEHPVAFHELQVLNLMKVAFMVLPVEPVRGEPQDLAPLGEALLMMSDLMESEHGAAPGTDEERAALFRDVFANGLFHVSDHDAHVLARSHDLYLVDRPHLRHRPDYIDLPAFVQRSIGLDADTLWAVYFALWSNTMPKPAGGKRFPLPLPRSTYFTSNFSFTEEEVDRFLAPIAVDATTLKAELASMASNGLDRYNVLPFLSRPLIQFGDRLVPACPRFVMEKLGRGLHFIGLNAALPKGERERYLRYIGDVFEDEVHQIFERVFGGRYRRLDPLKGGHEDQIADGLIALGDTVVVVETEAKLFTVGVRHAKSQAEMDRKLDETVLRGAHQIHATIEALRVGQLVDGLEGVRRWYPLVVTLERMPLPPMIYDEMARRVAAATLLAAPDVAPIQVLEIDDLEFLEQSLLTAGLDLCRVLEEKTDDPSARWETFGSYLHRQKEPTFLGGKNSRLHQRFHEIAKKATALYLERAREPPP